ncbi:hypothetical protein BJ989_003114 [Nocardioides perillae]|uniref:Uncharacterized protein n=1 Tax=Nocardioides perillae TaxID=1119534 RepID=A0A7Y9RZH2_9ACTN|nr:hypothetical protein [Nocardioides perillae]
MRVLHLTKDNEVDGSAQPWSLEAAERPYMVAIGNANGRFTTVALDFDAKRGEPGDADRHAGIVMDLFADAGMPAVLARSGPTGGRHVLLSIAGYGLPVESGRLMVTRLRALGLTSLDPSCMSSVRSGIRPPGAPHRRGGRSEVVGDPAEALARLRRDRSDTPGAADLNDFIDALALPSDMRAPLRRPRATTDGHSEVVLADRSAQLQRYATEVVAGGGDLNRLRAFLAALPADDAAAQHLAEKSPRGRDAALTRSHKKAVQWLAENPAAYQGQVDDQAVIAAWRERDLASLAAPLGPVAVVLPVMAEQHRQRLVGTSTRALAERTALSEASARRGLAKAVEVGMLEVADAGKGARARRYRLNPPEQWDAAVRDAVGPSPVKGGVRRPTASPTAATAADLAREVGNEVWYAEALGQRVRQVYLALHECSAAGDPAPTAAVAQRVSKSPRQVRDDLTLLAHHGLARQLGRAGWVSEYRDPRDIVVELGAAGVAHQRRRQHADQRQSYLLEVIRHRLHRKFGAPPAPVEIAPAGPSCRATRDQGVFEGDRGPLPGRKPMRASAASCSSRRARRSSDISRQTTSTRLASKPRPRRSVCEMRTASTCPRSSWRRASVSPARAQSSRKVEEDTR